MRVTPKTENEVRESGLWPVGEYDFEIVSSIEKLSQSWITQCPFCDMVLQVFVLPDLRITGSLHSGHEKGACDLFAI